MDDEQRRVNGYVVEWVDDWESPPLLGLAGPREIVSVAADRVGAEVRISGGGAFRNPPRSLHVQLAAAVARASERFSARLADAMGANADSQRVSGGSSRDSRNEPSTKSLGAAALAAATARATTKRRLRLELGKPYSDSPVGMCVSQRELDGALFVSAVAADSLAESAGVRADDIVLAVNGEGVSTALGCTQLMRDARTLVLLVEREAPAALPVEVEMQTKEQEVGAPPAAPESSVARKSFTKGEVSSGTKRLFGGLWARRGSPAQGISETGSPSSPGSGKEAPTMPPRPPSVRVPITPSPQQPPGPPPQSPIQVRHWALPEASTLPPPQSPSRYVPGYASPGAALVSSRLTRRDGTPGSPGSPTRGTERPLFTPDDVGRSAAPLPHGL